MLLTVASRSFGLAAPFPSCFLSNPIWPRDTRAAWQCRAIRSTRTFRCLSPLSRDSGYPACIIRVTTMPR